MASQPEESSDQVATQPEPDQEQSESKPTQTTPSTTKYGTLDPTAETKQNNPTSPSSPAAAAAAASSLHSPSFYTARTNTTTTTATTEEAIEATATIARRPSTRAQLLVLPSNRPANTVLYDPLINLPLFARSRSWPKEQDKQGVMVSRRWSLWSEENRGDLAAGTRSVCVAAGEVCREKRLGRGKVVEEDGGVGCGAFEWFRGVLRKVRRGRGS